MTSRKIVYFILIALLVLSTNIVTANTFSTNTGVKAITSNPAAVNIDKNKFTLEMGADVEVWNNLLLNGYISEYDKDKILKGIQDTGFALGSTINAGATLKIGPIASFARAKADGIFRFPEKIGELLLKGNEISEQYSLDNTDGKFGIYGDVGANLSFALPVKESLAVDSIYIGMNYHQLRGVIAQIEAEGEMGIDFGTEGPEFNGNGEFMIKYNEPENINDLAKGSAFDFGVYSQINDKLRAGFSLLNRGSMKVTGIKYAKFTIDSQEDEITQSEEGSLPAGSIEWKLPAVTKFGVNYQLRDNINILGDYSSVSYDNGVKDSQISVGTEILAIKPLPIRLATTYSSLKNSMIIDGGLGLYLGPLKTEIGVSDLSGIFNKAKSVSVTVNTRIEF